MEVYGVSKEEAEQLVKDFRERYVPIGVYESSPFPGIRELLETLRAAGKKVAIATSKPQPMAELLLEMPLLEMQWELRVLELRQLLVEKFLLMQ